KRCGIAVTDTMRIVASGLTTVPSGELTQFILNYIAKETVDAIIVGSPTTLQGLPSESVRYLKPAITALQRRLPENIAIVFWDERFTSSIAHRTMIDGGMKQSRRRDKEVVDMMAATIILNDYLESRAFNTGNHPVAN
ncbi:MAG: Holliday junction resolvase RuvX, partial [Muribaculum sp.]|nr:Holliday junction resolvase RuvX [Muribaculum sp.]